MEDARERELLTLFDAGLLLKGIFAALEIAGALLILVIRPSFVLKVATFVTAGEISEDPSDLVANAIRSTAHSFAIHPHYLLALYLFIHGAVKLILIIAIAKKIRIAYPLFIAALLIFFCYETYRVVATANIPLGILACFDFALALLTLYEYRRLPPLRAPGSSGAGQ